MSFPFLPTRRVALLAATAIGLSPATLFAQPAPAQVPSPAPTQPTPAQPAPADATSSNPEQPAGETPGEGGGVVEAQEPASLLLIVRVGDAQLADAEILIDGEVAGNTVAEGPTEITMSPGAHTLKVRIQPGALPERADQETALGIDIPLNVVAGGGAEAVLVLDAAGNVVSMDLRPVVTTSEATATEPTSTAGATASEKPAENAKAQGKLVGRILLSNTREAIKGAKIYVRRTPYEAVSDAQGLFTLELPQGTYDLAIVHPEYPTLMRDRVRVRVGQSTSVMFELTPSDSSPDDFTITAKYVKGGVAALMEERRQAVTVQDAIGAEDISRSPDSTASSATRRVVGASIVGGQFLLVRGLGGRYSNVRLNGVPLPSTDPDLPGFQIDLFPASLLSNLTITKTFSADIPGDFAGGSLNVVTKDFPEKFTLGVSAGASFNTETTFRRRLDYHGGSTDFLGFDDGTRAMPKAVPKERVAVTRGGLTGAETRAIGREFDNNWQLVRASSLPNFSLSANLGDTTEINKHKFGYLLTLGYRSGYQRYVEEVTRVRLENGQLVIRDELKREVGSQEAQIGTLGTVSYEPADHQKLTLVSLLTQTADDSTSMVTGIPESSGSEARSTEYRFVERQLLFNQLLGEHKQLFGSKFRLDWQVNMAIVARDQPDTRNVLYQQQSTGDFIFVPGPGSGERLYTELGQKDFGGGLDLTVPLWAATGKVGYLGRTSTRDFTARRFGFTVEPGVDRTQPPEILFEPIGFDDPNPTLEIDELTLEKDGYKAGQDSHAGYVMLDVPAFDDTLRLLPGARLEWFHQEIQSESPFETTNTPPEGTDRSDLDLLPAAAVVVHLNERMALRGSYGGTVARPLLRELSPFVIQDYIRRRTVQGNPDLERTFIHNFDLRWELFPSNTEVFAASVFYKMFESPIESVIFDTNGNLGFDNIDGANNYGVELEARFDLERFSDSLKNWSALANLAIIKSSVELSDEQLRVATSRERPLAGQSPYVANLSFGYSSEDVGPSAYVYYNVFGKRLQDVGRLGLPDIYEQPFHSVDMSAFYKFDDHWTLGISGTNLLRQPTVVKQGDFEYSRYNKGSTYGAKLAWKY